MLGSYFNEIDPFCAAWIRNLWPDAHVDERSICDIAHPVDAVRQHYFAGIGGWELALELAGWPADRPIWTGSCPCQPFSVAGKGGSHEDERDLWPAFLRLITISAPPVVIGEQVNGAITYGWLDRVCDDLEGIGYAVGAAVLPACGVGAPHIRQRLYWVALAKDISGWGDEFECRERVATDREIRSPEQDRGGRGVDGLALASGTGLSRQRIKPTEDGHAPHGNDADRCGEIDGLADSEGANGWRRSQSIESEARIGRRGLGRNGATGGLEHTARDGRKQGQPESERGYIEPRRDADGVGHTNESGREALVPIGIGTEARPERATEPGTSGGLGDTDRSRLEGHRRDVADWDQPRRLNPQSNGSSWAASISIYCQDGRYRRVPLEPSLQPLADSGRFGNPRIDRNLSSRIGALQAAGNAIVIPLAAEFIRAVMEVAGCYSRNTRISDQAAPSPMTKPTTNPVAK